MPSRLRVVLQMIDFANLVAYFPHQRLLKKKGLSFISNCHRRHEGTFSASELAGIEPTPPAPKGAGYVSFDHLGTIGIFKHVIIILHNDNDSVHLFSSILCIFYLHIFITMAQKLWRFYAYFAHIFAYLFACSTHLFLAYSSKTSSLHLESRKNWVKSSDRLVKKGLSFISNGQRRKEGTFCASELASIEPTPPAPKEQGMPTRLWKHWDWVHISTYKYVPV
jgi:hypothetical protein